MLYDIIVLLHDKSECSSFIIVYKTLKLNELTICKLFCSKLLDMFGKIQVNNYSKGLTLFLI